jgi:superoxide reductase
MNDHRFFLCEHCGNLVGMVHSAGVQIICCGEPMKQLEANTSEGAVEKHLPVIKTDGNKVTVEVGSAFHPMLEEHFIQWIYLQTKRGGQRKELHPGEDPVAVFALVDDEPVAAYAYCNLHGLWKTEIK